MAATLRIHLEYNPPIKIGGTWYDVENVHYTDQHGATQRHVTLIGPRGARYALEPVQSIGADGSFDYHGMYHAFATTSKQPLRVNGTRVEFLLDRDTTVNVSNLKPYAQLLAD